MDWEMEIRRALDGQKALTLEAAQTSALGSIRTVVVALGFSALCWLVKFMILAPARSRNLREPPAGSL